MAIAEYKEFFLRFIATNNGASPDKETGFPVKEIVIDQNNIPSQEFNRFLKKHFPSEAIYKKLFESITFKLNSEDTATREQQGLVRIAIGENIVNRKDTDDILVNGNSRKFTTVVVPSTLPKVSGGVGITVNVLIRRVSDDVIVGSITPGDRELYYIDYEVVNTAPSGDNISDYFRTKIANPSLLPIDPNDPDLIDLGSHIIPGNTLITNNDIAQYRLLWFDNSDIKNNGTLQIYVGSSSNITSCYKILDYTITDANLNLKSHSALFDIDIVRDDIQGSINTIQGRFFQSGSPVSTTPGSAPKRYESPTARLAHDGAGVTVPDSYTLTWNATHNDPKYDWGNDMYVHFRYKMNGGIVDDFAHNLFNIIGKVIKDS